MRLVKLLPLVLLFFAGLVGAEEYAIPGLKLMVQDGASNAEVAGALKIFVLMTVLSLAPSILIMLTAFVRIVIVLSMLRHAIGLQGVPPNIVITTLALLLTLIVMQPLLREVDNQVVTPYVANQINNEQAIEKLQVPLRKFLLAQTREQDLKFVIDASKNPIPSSPDQVSLAVLVPAFMLSELHIAFQIGFIIFLPFLLVDLVVSSVLMSMGMIMLPPLSISLPVKILMFVLIDGWVLVSKAILGSFNY